MTTDKETSPLGGSADRTEPPVALPGVGDSDQLEANRASMFDEEERGGRAFEASAPWRVAVIYAGLAGCWILFSDQLLGLLVPAEHLVRWQTFKGLAFVVVTAFMLAFLVRHYVRRLGATNVSLREARALLIAAVEQTPAGILIAEAPDVTIRVANSAALGIRGSNRDELVDIPAEFHPQHWQVFWPDGRLCRPEELPLTRAVQRGEVTQNAEFMIRRPDGETRWVLATAAPVRDAQGEVVAGIVVFPDVTELKRMESRLLRSQRLESIGTLASGVAHDLNNILAPILMGASLLRPQLGREGDLEMLEVMEGNARRGADIVKQLLTFGRGAEGERTRVELHSLLLEMVKVIQETFPKSVQLQQHIPKSLWAVSADATQIHQVLMNLCLNARDAMPRGGQLTVAAENVVLVEEEVESDKPSRGGAYVVLLVADSGPGMKPEVVDRMFEPFFTTKPPGQGTGLGLSTALGIVKAHGGWIRVQSRLGEGSLFKVYLPAETEGGPCEETESEAWPQGKGEVVLVVDDEDSVRRLTRRTLTDNGYRVIAANDGGEAIQTFRTQSSKGIQVVLTDLLMPVVDGRALIRAIRQMEPGQLIVLMSGLPRGIDDLTEEEIEVDAFLQKPFTSEQLLVTLRRVLSGG